MTDINHPPSTNGEGVKPLWKRKMLGSEQTYADFLDGRGIVMWNPRHREADEDGWLRSQGVSPNSVNWPDYNNEQDIGNGVLIHYYCGNETNIRLSPTQTAKWNEHHGYTPPLSKEEQREQELAAMTPQEREVAQLTEFIMGEAKRLHNLKIEEKRLRASLLSTEESIRVAEDTLKRCQANLKELSE